MEILQTNTPDPRFKLITRAQAVQILDHFGGDQARATVELNRMRDAREESIRLSSDDPLRYGYEPEVFVEARRLCAKYDEVLLSGGNRTGKTEIAGKIGGGDLCSNEGRKWAFFHSSETSSKKQQQPRIHTMLYPEWRNAGKHGSTTYVKFSKQQGFSDNRFVLPNSAEAIFFNYKQDISVFEGYEMNGTWFDELVPLPFIEAMRFRLGHEKLLILVTFTPVKGWSATVGNILSGMNITKTLPVDPDLLDPRKVHVKGCPPGHMPYIMEHPHKSRAAIFFHIGCNPFQPVEEVKKKLIDANESTIKIRGYGWADKIQSNSFSCYGPDNRISLEKFKEIEKGPGSRFLCVDPGGSKPWFCKWYFVTPEDKIFLYREWPDYNTYGDWALPPERETQIKWRAGPAQQNAGTRSTHAYKVLLLELEGWVWDDVKKEWNGENAEKIEERSMDPRFGGTPVPGEDEGTTIIHLADEYHEARAELPPAEPMSFMQAPASGVDETTQMINDYMYWDQQEQKSIMNCPNWYIVDERCQQSDLLYREWTGSNPKNCALKDILDPDRYFVINEPKHFSESDLETTTQGSGGY